MTTIEPTLQDILKILQEIRDRLDNVGDVLNEKTIHDAVAKESPPATKGNTSPRSDIMEGELDGIPWRRTKWGDWYFAHPNIPNATVDKVRQTLEKAGGKPIEVGVWIVKFNNAQHTFIGRYHRKGT